MGDPVRGPPKPSSGRELDRRLELLPLAPRARVELRVAPGEVEPVEDDAGGDTGAAVRDEVADARLRKYGCQPFGIFGAASWIKSTGAGGRGFVRSSRPLSSSVRLPFLWLHVAHDVTTFSQTDSPPRERGTTWSSVSRPLAVPQ